MSRTKKLLLWIVVLVTVALVVFPVIAFASLVYLTWKFERWETETRLIDNLHEATIVTEHEVDKRLGFPQYTEYPWDDPLVNRTDYAWYLETENAGCYNVHAWVNVKKSDGAVERREFWCQLEYKLDGLEIKRIKVEGLDDTDSY